MRRREFISLLGGTAAWPLAVRAQQGGPMRRIGVAMSVAAAGTEGKSRMAAFLKGLQQWGWTEGRNVRIDTRWGGGDAERTRKNVAELLSLGPDVFLASGDHPVVELQHATRTAPIVFTMVGDPVGAGFVESLARPGGNTTGFTLFEFSVGTKWLELLKEIAPGVRRAAVIRKPALPTEPASSRPFRRWLRRSAWSSLRSACAMAVRSSAASMLSRAPRKAV